MRSSQRSIVVVVGMHRGGTSLCSHLLTHLGYDMTDEPLRNQSNPKGHWERLEIVALHDRILQHFDRDYYSPNHAFSLPAGWWADAEVRNIRNELIRWLRDRMRGHALFGFKDPRTCLMFPLWKEVFAELDLEPKYVFCVRDPAHVVRSVEGRDKFDPHDTQYRWVRYNAHAIAGIGESGAAFIPFEDWFTNPAVNMNRLLGHLDLNWAPDDPMMIAAFNNVIAPELRHDGTNIPVIVDPFVLHLYRLLLEAVPNSRITPELRHAASNFIMVEQLHSYQQVASTALARNNIAQVSLLEDQRQVANELESRLKVLEVALDQEYVVVSDTNGRLRESEAALAAAREQIRDLEAALTAARIEIEQSHATIRPLPENIA